ncbi:myopalladin isoform X2 [Takifugu rubripes]|uniref:myopalladin isoform X2 n=1 Tax=Takifugu rubripes TaxID=31033 RepID=UPI00114555C8|nr:myopalladin isoform X2 [Takifugu rubripes]
MQENTEQPQSLSQLLRESYMAEARAQHRHSRADASSSHLQFHCPLKGKANDHMGHGDVHFPDLSAFLSQEELDKSVNLARQAIGHEDRAEVSASVTPAALSKTHSSSASSEPLPVPLANHSVAPFTAPTNQPLPEFNKLPAAHISFTQDRTMHKTSSRHDNMIRNSRDSGEGINDSNRGGRNAPYNLETQSKKEFLNKAADFIEELSSLFKANSSKRIRPRSCKSHRTRSQNKSHNDGSFDPLDEDTRERALMSTEEERERPYPAVSHQTEEQPDAGIGHFQDCRITEALQQNCLDQDVEKETDGRVLTETSYPAEPVCEPPHFIQKLKSREIAEGSKVQLDCIVRGFPLPEVRWFCEGKELENSPDIQIINDGELHSLIISEAFEEDTGRYSCFASNIYGTDSTSAEIYVEGASSSDSEGEHHFEHTAQFQPKSLPPFSSQALSAEQEDPLLSPEAATEEPAEPPPPPTTNQIPPEPPAKILPVSDFSQTPAKPATQVTEQADPTLSVQGISALSASDPEHPESQTAISPVSLLPPAQSASAATSLPLSAVPSPPPALTPPTQASHPENQAPSCNYLQGLNGQPVMAAPIFTKNLQELYASEGQLVVLECRVKGVPSPRVAWYRNESMIEDSPDFRILQKKPRSPAEPEEICTLVIAEVFPEDSGMFTCTASNTFGTVSSTAALRVQGNGNSNHVRPLSSVQVEPGQSQEPQPEVTVTNSIKPHSSTICLDPLISGNIRLEPLNTCTLRLDPHNSSMLRPDPPCTSSPSVQTCSQSSSYCLSAQRLNPVYLHQSPVEPSGANPEPQNNQGGHSYTKPFTFVPAYDAPVGQVSRSSVSFRDTKVKDAPDHENGNQVVVPLPDPPPNSCLKSGTLTNHKDPRSSSRAGLRVHFKLPEDEEEAQSDTSCQSEDAAQMSAKEPPPVRAKPKLDPAQLQLLHNQVLLEQQQETEPQTQTQLQPQFHPTTHVQVQPEVQTSGQGLSWSSQINRGPNPPHFHTATPPSTALPTSAPLAPMVNTTFSPPLQTSPAPPQALHIPAPQLKTSSLVTSPPPPPQIGGAAPQSIPPVSQMDTLHTAHLCLSPVARAGPTANSLTPLAPKLSAAPVRSTPSSQQITSPAAQLRSTHAFLMNLTPSSLPFNYARPKEFIAAQTFSPVRSPPLTESPVPLLQELAAELNSSEASSPTIPPFSPPPRVFPTRVLMSPTSPPSSLVSSPTPGSSSLLSSSFAIRAQSPLHASSPTSSSSTPSPIQNPVAFLSSVLPSLSLAQPTNSMGLPKGAPSGLKKSVPKARPQSTDNVRESKEILHEIEKKLRFREETPHFAHQQEYKVSSFEQRLLSEIEFRLERTPVEESDDEVQHDDVPTGKCIAPIFEKKLKNFKATEGVPVTFSCKILGIPVPKVYWFKDGKQILKKNVHYRKIREGDGTCALHIECTTSDDDGNYTVMAANPQGRISCSGHLIVQTGPLRTRLSHFHSQRGQSCVRDAEGEQTQERFFQPHFLQAPGDMLAHEGKLCRLDCKVSGLPIPELMWLVNGKPIYSDLYHKMLVRENGVHSLVIDPLTQKDSGTYTCIASNKAGQSSFSLELTVVEKEMKYPPQFLEKLQNMGIPEGTPVRLECRVVGMPPPAIFWKKDNDSIPNTKERITMTRDATGYVCLLIQPTKKDDAGWYTVSAKNEAGIVSCTCRLDIYAQWHQSIPAPMRKAPRTGSRYAALTGQGLDIKSVFPTSETSPILFSSSPAEAMLESEEL